MSGLMRQGNGVTNGSPMTFDLDEDDRQLTLRALAVQSLESPGFELACRGIAILLEGEALFDSFRGLLKDLFP